MSGYLSREEVLALGFARVGKDVQISNKACFYGASQMCIGSHVRIDDFCIFIGKITLGDYIHIANYTAIHASEGSFLMGSYSTLSSRVAVYAASDDYSGAVSYTHLLLRMKICSDWKTHIQNGKS